MFPYLSLPIDLPPPSDHKEEEEFHLEQQLCNQESHTSLAQKDPEAPQIKEEQNTLPTSPEREQFVLKQEDNFKRTLTCEESSHSQSRPLDSEQPHGVAEKEPLGTVSYTWIKVESDLEDEANNDRHGGTTSARRTDPKAYCEPYKCLYCSKEYNFLTKLKAHMKLKHRCDRPFKCDSCGKMFKVRTALKFHIRTHTGEKPFKCRLCGTGFSRNFGLKMHLRIHTGERPYTCDDCGKTFSDRSCLRRHVRVHTHEKPYKCSWCGKGLADKVTLKRHTTSHTGEKPCKCDLCGKGFPDPQCLKMHKKTHIWQKQIVSLEKS
ncbi:Zinc finger protein 782 [Channa argus]|uniref:Zinc finger protein 782 n=1 Tax=Channa argus TaxID=215402 RepID=A0A6G1PYV5_CHAAH|nr:Zinc finger protein 782 [Channa argus]